MQNRQDIDGSQRPATADAPPVGGKTEGAAGHLGRGGDPVEGRDPAQSASVAAVGPGVADHLGAGGYPSEGMTHEAATGPGPSTGANNA